MARLTEQDKQLIISCYEELGTYSAVAKKTGFSASTVKKYVTLAAQEKQQKEAIDSYEVEPLSIEEIFNNLDLSTALLITEQEKDDIKQFLKLFNIGVTNV